MTLKQRIRAFGQNLALVAVSTAIALLLAEGVCHLVLDPVDYLRPETEQDPILAYRIKPGSAHHDAWGYRNKAVPKRADVVAIGDSLTYGWNAPAKNAWPAVLKSESNQEVYSLALGGYGPPQYMWLLENKALALEPKLVIAGFYLGNDLLDTYRGVYEHDHWKAFRNPDFHGRPEDQNDITRNPMMIDSGGNPTGLRGWLSAHSILYRLFTYSDIGAIARALEMKMSKRTKKDLTFIDDKEHNASTIFLPVEGLMMLDVNKDQRLAEGLRAALDIFDHMNTYAKEHGVRFLVLMIPTKESVYAPVVEHNAAIFNSARLDEMIATEREVDQRAKAFFDAHGIAYVDALDALRVQLGKQNLYSQNAELHPNQNGYRVIAECVKAHLDAHPDLLHKE